MGGYIDRLPRDQLQVSGRYYLYFSDTRNFQLFAALEKKNDAEYEENIYKRGLKCGSAICNFGVGSSDLKQFLLEDLAATSSAVLK